MLGISAHHEPRQKAEQLIFSNQGSALYALKHRKSRLEGLVSSQQAVFPLI